MEKKVNILLSIIIPVYILNKELYIMTTKCLKDIINSTKNINVEIIVVDDNSPNQNYIEMLIKVFPNITLIKNNINLGFAKSINKGIKSSKGNLILLLNNDIEINNIKCIENMIDDILSTDVGAISPSIGALDSNLKYLGERKEIKLYQNGFAYLVGWCMLVKRDVFENVGIFPENFNKGYFEDTLFSQMMMWGGVKLGVCKDNMSIKHFGHRTFAAAGYNLSKEFETKSIIFKRILEGKEKIISEKLPKLKEYANS